MPTTNLSSTSTDAGGTRDDDSAVIILPTTGTISINPTAIGIGLSPIKKCTTVDSIAKIVSEMISDKFDFDAATATVLKLEIKKNHF